MGHHGRQGLFQELANQPVSTVDGNEQLQLPETHSPSPFVELPFIDRKNQQSELDNYLKEAVSGQGRIVLLTGELGIGKTRLASEVEKSAERLGFRCLEAKCRNDSTSPLLPWIQYITQFCKSATADLFFKVCRESLNHIIRLVPDLSESVRLQPDAAENKIGDSTANSHNPEDIVWEEMNFILALTQVFTRLSENSPLLLILDDMQWCDASSLKVIDFLISNNLAKSRILLLCLLRDIDLKERTNQAVTWFFETIRGQVSPQYIHLSRFAEENVQELIEEFFPGPHDLSMNELRSQLYSRTRGNPLFLSEILKSLLERQIISKNDLGRWACFLSAKDFQLPETIKRVIEQRLELLDKHTLSTLQLASVIGERFSLETLDQVLVKRESGAQPSQSLDTALKSVLILEIESSATLHNYMFSDESVREVLYDQLDPSIKKSCHLIVAGALEPLLDQEKGFGKPRFSELANHFLNGGDLIKARHYFILAGKRASELYAHADAFARYQKALELLEEDTSESTQFMLEKADLLRRMGDESQFLPQVEKAYESWNRAAELYERCGEKLKAADLLVKVGIFYQSVIFNPGGRDTALERAVSLAGEYGNTPSSVLARITAWSLITDVYRGDRKKLIEHSATAMKLAEKSGAYDVIAMVSSYGIAACLVGEVEQAIESCDRGLKIAEEHGLSFEECYNYFHKASAYNYTYGPSVKSLELYLQGLNLAASKGNFMVSLYYKVELACSVYLPLGDWGKARQLAEETIASTKRFPGTSLFNLIAESAMGQVLVHEGDFAKAREYLEHVRDVTKGFGVLQIDVPLYIGLARLNIGTRNFEEAQENLDMGYRISKQRGLTVINAVPHIQLLDLMIEFSLIYESGKSSKDERFIEDILDDLIKSSKEINQPWTLAYVRRAEAQIAQHKKEFERARRLFQESIQTFEKLGWPYERAKTVYQLGVAQIKNGRLLTALDLFDSASEIFSKLGALADLRKITLLKKEIEDHGIPPLEKRPKFERKDTRMVFECLVAEFFQDSIFKKLEKEKCGWRSLSELHEITKVSRHSLYGSNKGEAGPALRELLGSGMVESRTFAGQRGRGGEVMKIRMSPQKTTRERYATGSNTEK